MSVPVQDVIDILIRHPGGVSEFVEAISVHIRSVKPTGASLARPGEETAPIGFDRLQVAFDALLFDADDATVVPPRCTKNDCSSPFRPRMASGLLQRPASMDDAQAPKEFVMVRQTLENRVEKLEHLGEKMSALEELPARVANLESQILLFRDEVRVEFSAVRSEMRDLGEQLRGGMGDLGEQLRAEMGGMGEQLRAEMGGLRGEMGGMEGRLRTEMHALNDQVLTQMRMLHEDVIDRIKLLGER